MAKDEDKLCRSDLSGKCVEGSRSLVTIKVETRCI